MAVGEDRQVPARRSKLQNGSAIKDFRRKAGITRSDLAERAGITYPHLANIENEHKGVTYEVLYRLAAALTVDIRSVLRNPPSTDELDRLVYEDAREQVAS
ncbi:MULTISPECIES: helix-turn-helix transcriptional regulator [unclassified Nonomuraea]|uniref:helix-turn-helix domain-containing protein n=1 Tax=unclassified Nonomuraea TaxID=2593643 RepID=UPI0033F8109C